MSPVKEIRCTNCNRYWGLAGPICIFRSPPCSKKVRGKKCNTITEVYRGVNSTFLFKDFSNGKMNNINERNNNVR